MGLANYLRTGETADEFVIRALKEAKVAVVSGTAFGQSQSARISFAVDDGSLKSGCQRLVDYLNQSPGKGESEKKVGRPESNR